MAAKVTWQIRESADRVVFRFHGYLSGADGVASATALAEVLRQRCVHVSFDVGEMDGYAGEARRAWQTVLMPQRRRILSITCIDGNPLVRMGASTLGLALGIPVRHERKAA
jgi:hypothetical protein